MKTRLIGFGALAASAVFGLAACGGSGTLAASVATVTVTATPTPSQSPSPSETFLPLYDDVNAYVNAHLPDGFLPKGPAIDNNQDLDGAYEAICEEADGRKPRTGFRNGFANNVDSGRNGLGLTIHQAGILFDTIVEGCYATDHATRPWEFNAGDYKYGDVLKALHEAGYDDFIQSAEKPDTVGSTCRMISNEKPGSYFPVSERKSWIKSLTGIGSSDWGWTETRASRFVDALFAACLSTGRSKPYVPPTPSFGNGTWRVGADVPTGSYRVASAADYCLWYRLNKMSSGTDPNAIIEWGWAEKGDPVLATIEPGDVAFQSIGCGTWKKIG